MGYHCIKEVSHDPCRDSPIRKEVIPAPNGGLRSDLRGRDSEPELLEGGQSVNVVVEMEDLEEVIAAIAGGYDRADEIRPCCVVWTGALQREISNTHPGTAIPCPSCRAVWVFCGMDGDLPLVMDVVDNYMLSATNNGDH